MRTLSLLSSLSVVLLAACGGDHRRKLPDDAGADASTVRACVSGTPGGPADLDILFVIDNSGSMAPKQEQLAAQFRTFASELAAVPGGMPNLHIGVVSSDVGSGTFQLQSCERANGDRGALQHTARIASCQPPENAFIADITTGSGRRTNYSGSLADTFACIATLGTSGCGFEQPLESMKRALDGSNDDNVGFLRPDAMLAVIIVTDEDDCSSRTPGALYNPADNTLQSTLGPLTSFRCTEFGWRCSPEISRAVPGVQTACTSREDSTFLTPVAGYVDFLRRLKGPDRVVVSAIAGDTGRIEIGADNMGNPLLLPSCNSAAGAAVPAVRIGTLVNMLGAQGERVSMCQDDWTPALRAATTKLAALPRCP